MLTGLLFGVTLAGCGGATPRDSVEAAVAKTTQAATMHVTTTFGEQLGYGPPFKLVATGDFDNATRQSWLSVEDVTDVVLVLGGPTYYRHAGFASPPSGTAVVYVKPPASWNNPSNTPWVEFDANQSVYPIVKNALSQLERVSPSAQMRLLELAFPTLHKAGREQIDGTDTVRYAGHVHVRGFASVYAVFPQLLRSSRVQSMLVPVEVWVGTDGLIRRIAFHADIHQDGVLAEFDVMSNFSRFGKPLDIKPPPKREVTNLT
jgi:hypothetical protein